MSTETNTKSPVQNGERTTLSFRAECEHDVRLLFEAILREGFQLKRSIQRSQKFPDVSVEMQTSASMEEIQQLLRHIPDSHVMLHTLRPVILEKNNLERDWMAL